MCSCGVQLVEVESNERIQWRAKSSTQLTIERFLDRLPDDAVVSLYLSVALRVKSSCSTGGNASSM